MGFAEEVIQLIDELKHQALANNKLSLEYDKMKERAQELEEQAYEFEVTNNILRHNIAGLESRIRELTTGCLHDGFLVIQFHEITKRWEVLTKTACYHEALDVYRIISGKRVLCRIVKETEGE